MSRFDLSKYETVESRLARFWADHPDGRVIPEQVEAVRDAEGKPIQYIYKATIYIDHTDVPVAVGHAEEIVGSSMVNKTSALENCETSAVGRALANFNYAPAGARPSREEMEKVQRAAPDDEITQLIAGATTEAELAQIAERIKGEPDPGIYRKVWLARSKEVAK